MYIAPLRLLEVLIVFFWKLWLVFQISRQSKEPTSSSACEDHVTTMRLSRVRLRFWFVKSESHHKAVKDLSKPYPIAMVCVVTLWKKKVVHRTRDWTLYLFVIKVYLMLWRILFCLKFISAWLTLCFNYLWVSGLKEPIFGSHRKLKRPR